MEFEDLEEELRFAFYSKYHDENASCLLNYMRALHFMKQPSTGKV